MQQCILRFCKASKIYLKLSHLTEIVEKTPSTRKDLCRGWGKLDFITPNQKLSSNNFSIKTTCFSLYQPGSTCNGGPKRVSNNSDHLQTMNVRMQSLQSEQLPAAPSRSMCTAFLQTVTNAPQTTNIANGMTKLTATRNGWASPSAPVSNLHQHYRARACFFLPSLSDTQGHCCKQGCTGGCPPGSEAQRRV